MTPIDLFNNYFPALADIPESRALDARNRVATYTQAGWPELDMRPNTPFGDFHLTPFAYLLAGLEIAMDRFRSDLNLENVANGVIYDCDFVKQFLGNFAVTARENMEASGVVRMVFNTDREYFIDRSALLSFEGNLFRPYTPNAGGVVIRRVGEPAQPGTNDVRLIDRGDGTFSADFAVVGTMTVAVTLGSDGAISPLPEELISLVALQDFQQGTPESSLPALAAKTRKTIYASANGTPGGILRYLNQEFPGIVSSSVVISGDNEIMRDGSSPFGLSASNMDIYARSGGYSFFESQTVRLTLNEAADKFMAKLNLTGQPYLLNSVTDVDGVVVPKDFIEVYSRSSNGTRAEMGAAAYSELEDLFLVVQVPLDSEGVPRLEISYNADGSAYIDVIVNYRTDPMIPFIRAAMTSRDFSPVGVDVLVRSFIPVVFKKFVIHYTRRAGTSVQLETARAEVLSYANKVGYPDVFSESRLHDGVFLAGAHDVVDVEAVGEVRWSLADYFLPSTTPTPIADYDACVAARREAPRISFPNIRALRSVFRDPHVGTSLGTYVAAGARNMTYVLDSSQITFTEEA